MLLLFIRFLLIGKAFIEPRHYGGVFVLQKYATLPSMGTSRVFYLQHRLFDWADGNRHFTMLRLRTVDLNEIIQNEHALL